MDWTPKRGGKLAPGNLMVAQSPGVEREDHAGEDGKLAAEGQSRGHGGGG